ncbi:MAG: T9SS type A sorting domain-containing protein [Syntrophothermus sp.]
MKKIFTTFLVLAGLYSASFAQHSWTTSFYFKYPKGGATATFYVGKSTLNEGQPYAMPAKTLEADAMGWSPVYNVLSGASFEIESGAVPNDKPIDSMQVTVANLNPTPANGFYRNLVDQPLWLYLEVVVYSPGKVYSANDSYYFTTGKYAKVKIPINNDLKTIWALIGINPSNPELGLAYLINGVWTSDGSFIKIEGNYVVLYLPHFSKFGGGTKTLIANSGVEERKLNSIPGSFELSQNYPNPFNPSTKISYSLPENGNVSLKVHNSLGVEVATLASGYKSAGTYEVTFSASNLPSGIYFYTLTANNRVSTHKMMLIK